MAMIDANETQQGTQRDKVEGDQDVDMVDAHDAGTRGRTNHVAPSEGDVTLAQRASEHDIIAGATASSLNGALNRNTDGVDSAHLTTTANDGASGGIDASHGGERSPASSPPPSAVRPGDAPLFRSPSTDGGDDCYSQREDQVPPSPIHPHRLSIRDDKENASLAALPPNNSVGAAHNAVAGPSSPASSSRLSSLTPPPETSPPRERSAKRPKHASSAQLELATADGARPKSAIPPSPYFSVVRSNPNSPANPHILRIHKGVTDAPKSHVSWPKNVTPGERVAGKLNWYELQPKDVGTHRMWRVNLGHSLARDLDLDDGEGESWILESWPDDYVFTIHHSSTTSSHKDRTDPYLFGSPSTKKFRSANEFAPHLFWLMRRWQEEGLRCYCKYCNGNKLQRLVNHDLGLSRSPFPGGRSAPGSIRSGAAGSTLSSPARSIGSPAGGTPSSPRKVKAKRVQSSLIPEDYKTTVTSNGAKSAKANGIAIVGTSEPAPSHFQTGPQGPTYNGTYTNKQRDMDLGDGARYRYCELVWVRLPEPLRDLSVPHAEAEDHVPDLTCWPALISDRMVKIVSAKIAPSVPGAAPTIRNTETFVYSARLLAVFDELTLLKETSIMPWKSYEADRALTRPDLFLSPQSIAHVWDGTESHRPRLDDFKGDVRVAPTSFSLAVQIAAHLMVTFSLMDKYKLHDEHIKMDSKAVLTEEEKARVEEQLGAPHYQQMWSGAELMWSGELVRLKLDAESIIRTSASGREPAIRTSGKLAEGANLRSLFFKSSGIYRTLDNQGMLAGKVYELRPVVEEDESSSATALASSRKTGSMLKNALSMTKSFFGGSTAASASNTPSMPNGASVGPSSAKNPDEPPANPLKDLYMPPPPPGYEFHCLTDPSENVHLSMAYLAGRYHPLPSNMFRSRSDVDKAIARVPALKSYKDAMARDPVQESLTMLERQLAMAGLAPGFWSHTDVYIWCRTRHHAVIASEEKSQKEMFEFLKKNLTSEVMERVVAISKERRAARVQLSPSLGLDQDGGGNEQAQGGLDGQNKAGVQMTGVTSVQTSAVAVEFDGAT
ncbi:BQ2448_6827 [Microbotryum intermedium]|uniref:BQ2448_6827 protein n=1 Tax=Microbotryum intermedium TaxID=269621 RepID=A0A238FMK6_9BASI|nr:BQ2448_6827 [Microbotryum intermedium]